MHSQERWKKILDALSDEKVTSVEYLTELLGASPATIRRDLAELHSRGELYRVRGGVMTINNALRRSSSSGVLVGQGSFRESEIQHIGAKKAIGEYAISLCSPGEPIIIDGGTTTYIFAKQLPDQHFQILTTSLPILQHLITKPHVQILMAGGEVFREQSVILSPYEEGILHHFSASKIFVGAQQISAAGLMQTDPLLVKSERHLIEHAKDVIVLVDSSKFSTNASLTVCPLSRISKVITDDGIENEYRAMLEESGVEVVAVATE